MKLTKTIELNIKKTKTTIKCFDTTTLQLVVGSSAVLGNYKYYGVTKDKDGSFNIPITKLKERLGVLNRRKKKLDDTINIMEQILR